MAMAALVRAATRPHSVQGATVTVSAVWTPRRGCSHRHVGLTRRSHGRVPPKPTAHAAALLAAVALFVALSSPVSLTVATSIDATSVLWSWVGNLSPTGATLSAKLRVDGHSASCGTAGGPDDGDAGTSDVELVWRFVPMDSGDSDDSDAGGVVEVRTSMATAIAAADRGTRHRAADSAQHVGVKLSARKLTPSTSYAWSLHARCGSGGAVIPWTDNAERAGGSLTTPGPTGSRAFNFSVALSSCAVTGSNSVVFDAIAQEESRPLVFLTMGDLFYADVATNDTGAYEEALDATLSAPRQSRLYRSMSTVWQWDDHDYADNNSDKTHPGRHAAALLYRRLAPHYPLGHDLWPAGAEDVSETQFATYHAFTLGTVRFIVTDLRSQRTPNREPDTPEKTVLGAEQKAWFMRELEAAAAAAAAPGGVEGDASGGHVDLVVWVSTMPWLDPVSKWGWFQHEARDIVGAVGRLGLAERFLVVSGDAHMVALDDGTHSPHNGGFPSINAAAMDSPPSVKGGPFSHGVYAGRGQYGTLRFEHRPVAPGAGASDTQLCYVFTGRRVASAGANDDATTPVLVDTLVQWDSCRRDPPYSSPHNLYQPPPDWVQPWLKRVRMALCGAAKAFGADDSGIPQTADIWWFMTRFGVASSGAIVGAWALQWLRRA